MPHETDILGKNIDTLFEKFTNLEIRVNQLDEGFHKLKQALSKVADVMKDHNTSIGRLASSTSSLVDIISALRSDVENLRTNSNTIEIQKKADLHPELYPDGRDFPDTPLAEQLDENLSDID
jgi:uncharacterized phage infection (PIP) family protein YhgE